MTKPFLRQVAEHYLSEGFEGRLFVFPNRRSIAFFKKHVGDILKERSMKPILSPKMQAVNEFFSGMTGRRTADRITLLLKLYDCYCACYRERYGETAETLDDFIFWGDTLLSDFDDIDKYRVDPDQLFQNIADLREISADYSFLSDTQREAMEKLAEHFLARNRQNEGRLDVKASFLRSWNILGELYHRFRKALSDEGLAYEGMVYRDLADAISAGDPALMLGKLGEGVESCVFVGLNALSECETAVLKALRKAGLAEFCWDFAGPFFEGDDAPKLKFIKENVEAFPNAFPVEASAEKPRVHVLSVPSATGQAKLLPHILGQVPQEDRGIDTAVVLPDESMLIPVLDSVPAEDINVTMGYSLGTSDWGALMQSVINMQLHVRGGRTFYYKQVYDIFSSGIFNSVISEVERQRIKDIKKESKAYIPVSDLDCGEVFKTVFRIAVTDMSKADGEQSASIARYLGEVVDVIASNMKSENDDIHLECAYRYLQCTRKLEELKLELMPKNLFRMLDSLIARVAVPFAGEPLGGLQIMGPLETRALDFKHLVLLNANEGTFPGKAVSNSIVPPELRKAFGLPTYELQDSIWTYYFYRMICRAEDVWMVYDSRTEGLNSGEESRFVKQLRYLYPDKCILSDEVASCGVVASEDEVILKTAEDIEAIRKAVYSASSIHKYLTCPAQFYYYVVKRLYNENEVHEDMDKGMVGTVCHDTLQAIYCCEEAMDPTYFFDKTQDDEIRHRKVERPDKAFYDYWKSSEGQKRIRAKVEALSRKQLNSPDLQGRNLVFVEVAMHYINKVLESDKTQLEAKGSLEIKGLEKTVTGTIAGHSFKGYIDRLDSFGEGQVRVVDYKTGSDSQNDLDASKPSVVVKKVFKGEQKAAFQFFVYDELLRQTKGFEGLTVFNTMYPMKEIFTEDVKTWSSSDALASEMKVELERIFKDLENPDIPFSRNPGSMNSNCQWCDYALLCGKVKKDK